MERIFAEAARARQKEAEGKPEVAARQANDRAALKDAAEGRPLPEGYTRAANGVVLGPDGKPCRTCMKTADWQALMRPQRRQQDDDGKNGQAQQGPARSTSATTTIPSSSSSSSSSTSDATVAAEECPPDVERLGRHTWTFLHATAAAYPERAGAAQQADMRGFLGLFARLYPCGMCAHDLRDWMGRPGNAPRVEGRDQLGQWMCRAHNEVNAKLGKPQFDCKRWRERWVDGWRDGRCG